MARKTQVERDLARAMAIPELRRLIEDPEASRRFNGIDAPEVSAIYTASLKRRLAAAEAVCLAAQDLFLHLDWDMSPPEHAKATSDAITAWRNER